MITKENLTYAIRNLMNRKVRSFLTILSILVGITTIFIFVSFGMGLYFFSHHHAPFDFIESLDFIDLLDVIDLFH